MPEEFPSIPRDHHRSSRIVLIVGRAPFSRYPPSGLSGTQVSRQPTLERKMELASIVTLMLLGFCNGAGPNFDHFRKQHSALIKDNYVFLGWHGISNHKEAEYIKQNKRWPTNAGFGGLFYNKYPSWNGNWNGLYVSSTVERSFGYVSQEPRQLPWIFRVYIKKDDIKSMADGEVKKWFKNDASDVTPTPTVAKNPTAKYIFWGPDGTGEGFEMVLSPAMAHKTSLLLSTYTAQGYKKDKWGGIVTNLQANQGEASTTTYGTGTFKEQLLNARNNF